MQYQNFSGKFESWYLALQQLEVDNSRLDELGIQLKDRYGQAEQQTEVINPSEAQQAEGTCAVQAGSVRELLHCVQGHYQVLYDDKYAMHGEEDKLVHQDSPAD